MKLKMVLRSSLSRFAWTSHLSSSDDVVMGIQETQEPENDELCSRCRLSIMSWPLSHIRAQPQCPFCQLVLAGLQMDTRTWKYISSLNQHSDPHILGTSPADTGEIWLQVKLPLLGSVVPLKTLVYSSYSIRMCSREPNGWHLTPEYPVQLMRWVSNCRDNHTHHPDIEADDVPPKFRLIDVYDNKLIDSQRDFHVANDSVSYWALSYVWGGDAEAKFTLNSNNKQDLENDGSLNRLIKSNKLSKTICDAINVTRRARQRYLWVDSLCISQDDHEKHAQLCAMDTIYRRADLVLIATSGTTSEAGLLPGLPGSGIPNAHHIENIPGRGRYAACPSLYGESAEISKSPCHSRGWTLQEYALSQRAAFFTDTNILLTCGDELFDLNFDLTNSVQLRPADELRRPTKAVNTGGYVSSTVLYRVIRQYLNRVLSFEDDILNAMEGIFSHCLGGPDRHYWGIPENGFGNWLGWYCNFFPRDCSTRRRDRSFPSWSWAAWKHCGIACCVVDFEPGPEFVVYRAGKDGELVQLHGKPDIIDGPVEQDRAQQLKELEILSNDIEPSVLSSVCFVWSKLITILEKLYETPYERSKRVNEGREAPVVVRHYVEIPRHGGDSLPSWMEVEWEGPQKVYSRVSTGKLTHVKNKKKFTRDSRWVPLA